MITDEAAKATRKYCVDWHGHPEEKVWQVFFDDSGSMPTQPIIATGPGYATMDEAQAACDRLNLIAVLEALREPSAHMSAEGNDVKFPTSVSVWRAMIDALIAEAEG